MSNRKDRNCEFFGRKCTINSKTAGGQTYLLGGQIAKSEQYRLDYALIHLLCAHTEKLAKRALTIYISGNLHLADCRF